MVPVMRALVLIAAVAAAGCSKKEGVAVLGKPAELFGPLTKIKFGMRDTELVEVLPDFKIECVSSCRAKAVVDKVEYTVRLRPISKRVFEVSAAFEGVAADVVIKRWGAGMRVSKEKINYADDMVFYSDAKRTMRAWVHSQTFGMKDERVTTYVTFRPLMPLDKAIDPQKLTVGGLEVLGRKAGDLRHDATEKGYEAESDHIWMAPTELGGMQTYLAFDPQDGVVTQYRLSIPTDQAPDAKATILATLARTFGNPTPDAASKDELVYPPRGKIQVRSRVTDNDVTVTVEPASEPT